MLRFFLGLFAGALLSFIYVRYDVQLPEWAQAPETLRRTAAAAAAHEDLYDLSKPKSVHTRALEVYLQNQAEEAARIDAGAGQPFLKALYRRRVAREARILRGAWKAFDVALDKPALRENFERKYGVSETVALKQAMLAAQLKRHQFLASWMQKSFGDVPNDQLMNKLVELSRQP